MRKTILLLFVFAYTLSTAQQWKELGPCGSDTYGNRMASQGGTGQIHCILFDPDSSNIVYCGSPTGGLWKSLDSGRSWSNTDIDIHQDLEFSSACDIAITKKNGVKTLWLATGHPGARGVSDKVFEPYSCGIYTSTNGGETFIPVQSFNKKLKFAVKYKKHISRIVASPVNPDVLFVATSDGVYRTVNGGKTWKLVLTEEETESTYQYGQGIFDVEFSKVNPGKIIYASGRDVYRSVNAGKRGSFKSFTHNTIDFFNQDYDCIKQINLSLNINTDSLSPGHDVVYALAHIGKDTCGALAGKTALCLFYYNGTNWALQSTNDVNGIIDDIRLKMASVPNHPDIIYYGAPITNVSSNYGKTWKTATQYNQNGHADIHAIVIFPGTNDMLTGTDGGIFRYHYNTGKVDEYNNGLCIAEVIDMGASLNNPDKIIIGMQDIGSDIWDGHQWRKTPNGGDGYMPQHIDYADDYRFFSCANFSFTRNDDSARILLKSQPICTDGCPYVFVQSRANTNKYYYARSELFRSTDRGVTWCRISDFKHMDGVYINPNGHIVSDIALAPSDSNTIYVSFNALSTCCNTFLFKTTTGGMSCSGNCGEPQGPQAWKVLTNIPHISTGDSHQDFIENGFNYIKSIAISDKDPNVLWIGFGTDKLDKIDFKVYCSNDGGESWLPDEEGLPDYPVTKIIYVNGSNNELFLGTWNGVYYKKGDSPWQKYGTGLPHAFVSDMEINYVAHKLRVSTFGRGVWEAGLP